MILFGKVMVAFLVAGALLKLAVLTLPDNKGRVTTAIDLLLYGSLAAWGLTEWATL